MRFFVLIAFVFAPFLLKSQNTFDFKSRRGYFSMHFKQAGNLILLNAEINGKKGFNFVLDSGSKHSIISSLDAIEELSLKRGKLVDVKGLGHGYQTQAYLSEKNQVKIGKARSDDVTIVLLISDDFDLSERFGVPVHGILGYDIFKSFIVSVDYQKNKVTFIKPDFFEEYKKKKLQEHETIPLKIYDGKSYVEVDAEVNGSNRPLHLLLDIGSWDSFWLFSGKDKELLPDPSVNDLLGFGLSGPIYGKRGRIEKISFGKYDLNTPTSSFPDSVALAQLDFSKRNGSLGSEVMRRFKYTLNYFESKLYIKPTKDISDGFHYNMAGLELTLPYPGLPVFAVEYVREGSPAHEAGVRQGDMVQSFNGFSPNEISLNDIFDLFRRKEGKRITLTFIREGEKELRRASFKLKRVI